MPTTQDLVVVWKYFQAMDNLLEFQPVIRGEFRERYRKIGRLLERELKNKLEEATALVVNEIELPRQAAQAYYDLLEWLDKTRPKCLSGLKRRRIVVWN